MTSNCKLYFSSGDFSQGFNLILTIERDRQSNSPPIPGKLSPNNKILGLYEKWQVSYLLLLDNNPQFRGVFDFDESIATNESNQSNDKFDKVNFCRQCWHDLTQEMRRWLEESLADLQPIESALNGEFTIYPQDSNLLILVDNYELWKLPWYEWQLLINHPFIGVSFGFASINNIPSSTSNYDFSHQHQSYQANYYSQGINTNRFSVSMWLNQLTNLVGNIKEDLRIYFRRQKSVRILGVLGDDTIQNTNQTLNLHEDKKTIQQLNHSAPKFLDKPSLNELIKYLTHNYDLLSYSGHSDNGLIYINQSEFIRINDFNYHLRDAVNRGLKIFIFNSCDGIPFGIDILKRNLPLLCIVMQEAIPDKIAYLFLRQLLTQYSEGKSLSTSVRLAQQKLQGETIPETTLTIPGVESLPTLIQLPSQTPPTYQQLQTPSRRQFYLFFNIKKLILISLLITVLVVGLRWFGKLQPMELKAYDNLIQQQIATQPDSRLVVIRITPKDKEWLNQCPDNIGAGARTLSDANIGKIISKLQSLQAKLIGIDLFREGNINEDGVVKCENNNLENADHPDNNPKQFRDKFRNSITIANSKEDENNSIETTNNNKENNPNVIVVCAGNTEDKPKGIKAPNQAHSDNIGFADLVFDRDNIIRRQLLYMSFQNPDVCGGRGKESFSLKLAQRYLASQEITRQDGDEDNFIQLGETIFPPLQLHRGGYNLPQDKQQIEGGIQIMLNYRKFKNYQQDIAPSFTLQQLFEDKITASEIKDKIVLIGVDQYRDDRYRTPFTPISQTEKDIPGVFIHAQMTSSILDIVTGKRQLIWSLPWWIDMLIIGFFSLIGGAIIFILFISRLSPQNMLSSLIIIGIINYVIISGISWLSFNLVGLWFPFFPSFIAIEMIIIGAYIANFLKHKYY